MKDDKNWHRIYFNRQTASGAPDKPSRLNIRLESLEQAPSTVAIQLEYSEAWSGAAWILAPHKDFVEGLRLACCHMAVTRQDLLLALGGEVVTKADFEHQAFGGGKLQQVQLVSDLPQRWRVSNLASFGTEAASALRSAIVSMLKYKITIARAQGMKDSARVSDILARIQSRVRRDETAPGEHSEGKVSAKIAFFGDPLLKQRVLAQVAAHREAGEILVGSVIWSGEFGSATGCTVHGEDLAAYESQLGIPTVLAYLKEALFRNFASSEKEQQWPEKFLSAIKQGSALSNVWGEFLDWLITDKLYSVTDKNSRHFPSEPSPESQLEVCRALSRLFRGRCQEKASWNQVSVTARQLSGQFMYPYLGAPFLCLHQVAQLMIELPKIEVDNLSFDMVSSILSMVVQTIAERLAAGGGHDGPSPEEVYPRVYAAAASKLLELLAAAPVI